jgi:YHS domain-containing protein
MKKAVVVLGIVVVAGLASAPLLAAQPQGQAQAAPSAKPQTACPVCGGPLGEKKVFVDYQGQRIYFCSPNEREAFLKDPEKYFAEFEKQGIELENIQTSCPVSGEKLGEHGEASSIRYKGRTVKFCCPACEKPFRAEPEKYLAKLPGENQKQGASSPKPSKSDTGKEKKPQK